MTLHRLLPLMLLGVAAGCTSGTTSRAPEPATTAIAASGMTGPAQSCVGLQRIRESRVRSDQVIDFVMIDGTIFRNTLPYSCPQLGFERAFTYATSLSQLCSTDIVTVIVQGGGPSRGASCGLGQFQPISAELAKADVPRAK